MRKTCLNEVYHLAQRDPRVVFVGSDIGAGTLNDFKEELPGRFFMEGVCEAGIIGLMSGLAMNGMIPYLNTIAVFLTRRCYEQILLDAALPGLKIRLIGSGGGLVYAPLGSTHLAFDDIALMRAIPGMTIVAPCDAEEMKRLMPQTLDHPGPIYIRLGKGGDPVVSDPARPFRIGEAILRREGSDALLVTTGVLLKQCLEAADLLTVLGIDAAVLHMHTVKPLDAATLLVAAQGVRAVVSVEEHSPAGGLGSAVAEVVAEAGFSPAKRFARMALPDTFHSLYGSQASMLGRYGLTPEAIAAKVGQLLHD